MNRFVLVLATAATAVVGLAGPASADTRVFFDARGETGWPRADVTRVAVDNGSGHDRVIVHATVGRNRLGDVSHLWVSTSVADRGPEYRMTVIPDSDGLWLDRMGDDFWTPVERNLPCTDLRARSHGGDPTDDPDVVRFSIPRECLGNPQQVQVAVRHKYTPDNRTPRYDWARGYKQFFGLVAAG